MADKRPRSSLLALQARVFSLTWIAYASYYLARKNFSVVKATLEDDLGVSVASLATIDTAYLALYAVGQIVSGALGDRIGARRVIGIGMLGAGAAAAIFGLGSSPLLFGVAFGLQGLFQSTGWPSCCKALAPWLHRRIRGRVMGIWCTCYQVGGLAGTALAAYLLTHVGWREAFYVPALWVAFVGVGVWALLVERPEDRGLPPVADADRGDADEGARADRPPLLRVLAIPAVWAYGGSYFGLKLIRYSLLFWLPYYLTRSLGYDEGAAGYLSMFFEVGGILGAIATGWLSDRYFPEHRSRLLVPMIFALAVALYAYDALGSMGMVANAATMAAVGFLLVGPEALMTGAIPQEIGGGGAAASAAGVINGMGSAGAVFQGVITATVSEIWGWEALFHVFVVLTVISGLVLLPMARRR